MADVAIVGAGLTGLAAAVRLHLAGLEVEVFEASDAVGGRVRTDRRDGLQLDHGFQLLNPAYPEARRVLDLDALDLRSFGAGVTVHRGGARHTLGDPLRLPSAALPSVRAPFGSLREKVAAARWGAAVGFGPVARIRRCPDESLEQTLHRHGLTGEIGEIVRLFLAGVVAEDELLTSRRFGEFLLRSFVRGTPAVPARGMQAMPEQLAARLPDGTVRLNTAVRRLDGRSVVTDDGTVAARAVVVAADPVTAGTLLGRPAPAMKALTTYYHLAAQPPATNRLLHIDLDRGGPIVNTAVVSNVAPGYADRGALVATTVLGAHGAELESAVRAQAGRIYGVEPAGWELAGTYAIGRALPAVPPGQPLQRRVDLGDGRFVAGDHRDTASIQGALVSGRRAADAVIARLGRSSPAV
ncbi:MAG TPA: NAD(P)/FAD-dependent oxidoreductase [Jatrophihabitans sp.]|jgi:phytoene dehydrogenase-like protein|uniref:NAD(P)/FAD-dependent oxidoreductase n=1 Tax=Jatrophihabitans sp. TaxID=1932789 RepID=UPI002E0CF1A7|nr:NAD(P)/FAD-dependent oxidoreductase [Jatrophihabitans sp.]